MATKKNDFQKKLADREAQNPAMYFVSAKKDQDAPEPATVTAPAASNGTSFPEKLSNAAIGKAKDYFEQTGIEIDPALFEPRTNRFQLLISPVLLNRAKNAAAAGEISVNEFICRAVSAATYSKEED